VERGTLNQSLELYVYAIDSRDLAGAGMTRKATFTVKLDLELMGGSEGESLPTAEGLIEPLTEVLDSSEVWWQDAGYTVSVIEGPVYVE
jgi:hypothetical protein